jgi:hypothetical protein
MTHRGRESGHRSAWVAAVLGASAIGCLATPQGLGGIGEVRFESGAERPAFEISARGSRIEVSDGSGALLVRLDREKSAVVTFDGRGRRIGEVRTRKDDGEILYEWFESAEAPLLGLERETDGDFELEDAAGETIYELKRRSYGFKVVDAEDETVLRVRLSESGKISVRDANDVTYLTTRDRLPIEAATVWSLPELDFARASALAVAIWLGAGEDG